MLGFVLLNNDSPDINSVYVSIFENVIRYNRKNNPHTPYYPEIIVGGGVDQVAASGKITHFLNNAKASRVAAVEFVNVPPSPLCAA